MLQPPVAFSIAGGCKKVAVHSREQAPVPSEATESVDGLFKLNVENNRIA